MGCGERGVVLGVVVFGGEVGGRCMRERGRRSWGGVGRGGFLGGGCRVWGEELGVGRGWFGWGGRTGGEVLGGGDGVGGEGVWWRREREGGGEDAVS
jgi:hypothetical protein